MKHALPGMHRCYDVQQTVKDNVHSGSEQSRTHIKGRQGELRVCLSIINGYNATFPHRDKEDP